MSARPLILWGGTGHARVIREALDAQQWRIAAVFDRRAIPSPFDDVPIFLGEDGFTDWLHAQPTPSAVAACVAIGGTDGRGRLAVADFLAAQEVPLPTIIHGASYFATTATSGDGCHILAHATVCANANLGRSVIVNTAASVDHDCVIGDAVHIAPGARLAGEVIVEPFAFIGTGAIVLPRVRIGEGAIVGAGAVITKDVPSGMTFAGNPARAIHAKN